MSEFDPAASGRQAWTAGRKVGAKRALKPKQIWGIRFLLDQQQRLRDRALFDLAIDSKLRDCDVVRLKIVNLVIGGQIRSRAIMMQQKTGRPVQFEIFSDAGAACSLGSKDVVARLASTSSPAASTTPTISARGGMPVLSINGLPALASAGRITVRTLGQSVVVIISDTADRRLDPGFGEALGTARSPTSINCLLNDNR